MLPSSPSGCAGHAASNRSAAVASRTSSASLRARAGPWSATPATPRIPITAQGISDAFRSAERCAGALDASVHRRRSFETRFEYQRRATSRLPIYEFTTQLATLEPPPPELRAARRHARHRTRWTRSSASPPARSRRSTSSTPDTWPHRRVRGLILESGARGAWRSRPSRGRREGVVDEHAAEPAPGLEVLGDQSGGACTSGCFDDEGVPEREAVFGSTRTPSESRRVRTRRSISSRMVGPRRRPACGVVEGPVLVARAGVEGAGVAAAHGDHHVGGPDDLVGPALGDSPAMSMPTSAMASTAAGLISGPGSEPPDQATARSPARRLNQPRAICDRPALWTHGNRTVGRPPSALWPASAAPLDGDVRRWSRVEERMSPKARRRR